MSDAFPFEFERLSHQAMATTFEVLIAGKPDLYHKQAAREVFNRLTKLEHKLSRFVPNSEITRLNLATVDEPVLLSLDVFACLEQALAVCDMTQGALNICMGLQTARLIDPKAEHQPVVQGSTLHKRKIPDWRALKLDADALTATRTDAAVQIDLGAVGKGFALDIMAETLKEWDVTRCLLHGGGSTVLAVDGPDSDQGWPVTISYPDNPAKSITVLAMKQGAISSSSQMEQSHIVSPETGVVVAQSKAAWSKAPSAIQADGLSTAFMILSDQQIKTLCEKHPTVGAMVWQNSEHESVKTYGGWDSGAV